jgi:dihydroorotase
VIQAISSHHQPHERDAKLAPFGATEPGISSVELLLPLAMTLVQDGLLDLPTLLARLSAARRGPAPAGRAHGRGGAPTWCCSTRKPDRGRRDLAVARARTARSSATACRARCAAPWWTAISSTRCKPPRHGKARHSAGFLWSRHLGRAQNARA